MERRCFLCNTGVKTVIQQTWDLPGLASSIIGFSICSECGLVLQSPTVEPPEMDRYYAETAVYHNPSRSGRPPISKVRGVERQIQLIMNTVGRIPESLFQVGCSDGYTLSAFRKAGATVVTGIDPGISSNRTAREFHGVDTITGRFEAFEPDRRYELVILTHVLEHLYDPVESVLKCSALQNDGDWMLVEVPLLERIDRLPVGYFSFEHLNYFSESTILRLLSMAGYVPYHIEKSFYTFDYPLITLVARKEDSDADEIRSDYKRAGSLLSCYFERERSCFESIERRIKRDLKKGTEAYIWGAGIHTSQLLASTALRSYLSIKGLLDSSPTKWGKKLGTFTCLRPDDVVLRKGDVIIISSYASEGEIYEGLKEYRRRGVVVKRLYGDAAQTQGRGSF